LKSLFIILGLVDKLAGKTRFIWSGSCRLEIRQL